MLLPDAHKEHRVSAYSLITRLPAPSLISLRWPGDGFPHRFWKRARLGQVSGVERYYPLALPPLSFDLPVLVGQTSFAPWHLDWGLWFKTHRMFYLSP